MKVLGEMLGVGLLLLASACSWPVEADWYGDERFTAEERSEIEHGLTWLFEQAERPRPSIAWGYNFRGDLPLAKTIRRQDLSPGEGLQLGFSSGWHGTIYLDPENAQKQCYDFAGVAAHEFAHAEFGFKEGPEASPGLMRAATLTWGPDERLQCALSPYCGRD